MKLSTFAIIFISLPLFPKSLNEIQSGAALVNSIIKLARVSKNYEFIILSDLHSDIYASPNVCELLERQLSNSCILIVVVYLNNKI